MKTWIMLFLTIWSLCLCTPMARASQSQIFNLPDGAPEKVIIVNSTGSAPFHFVDDEGKPVGMLIDLWHLWSQKTGIEIEFISKPWGETLKMMQEGKADIHAGLFYSAKRDAFLDYASALHDSDTHFFFHKSIFEISDVEDLMPFRLGMIEGDKAVEYVSKKLPNANLALYQSNTALFDAIEEGEIRVFVKDTPIALYHLAKRGIQQEFKYLVNQPMYSNMFYAGVREGNQLLQAIVDQGMMAITKKERAAIIRKWMGGADKGDENVLSIAIASGYMPFSGLGLSGEPIGLVVDFWKLWSQKTGRKIDFLVDDWGDTLALLRKGHVDIHSGLLNSPERQEWIDFSQPFYEVDTSILYHGKQASPDLDSLKGNTIGVVKGSYQEEYLRQSFPDVALRTYQGAESMVMDMIDNKLEYILDEKPSTEFLLNKIGRQDEFKWFSNNLFSKKIYAGVTKGNKELLSLIDEGLAAITNQELAAIEKNWINNNDLRKYSKINKEVRLTQDEESWLANHKKIRLGVDPDFPPFDFFDKNGKHSGFAASYVDIIANRLGISMTAEQVGKWTEVLAKAGSGELDVIPCIVKTPDREKILNFTKPYLSFPMVIVTRENSPLVIGLNDLKGKKITVVKDYFSHETLKDKHPELNLLPVESVEEGLLAISQNKAYAFVGNLAVTSYVSKRMGIANLKIAVTTQYTYDLSFAVRKDWPILPGILDKALLSISEEEKSKIRDTWVTMQFEHKADWRLVFRWFLVGLGVSGSILAVIIIWNRKLAHEIIERKKIESALLLDEERLESLLKLTQLKEIPEDEIFEYSIEECVRLTRSTIGYLHFINPDKNSVTLFAWSKGTEKYCKAEKNPHYPLKEAGVWADCIRTGKPAIHNDYQSLASKKNLPEGHVKLLRHMSVPILADADTTMVMGVGNKETPYTDSDVRQITLFMQSMWRVIKSHRAEEQLQFTQYAMDESSDDVLWIEQDGKICYANEAACQSLGFLAEELDNMSIFDIDQDFSEETWATHWQKVKMYGSLTAEKIHRTEDGSTFPVEITVKFMQFGAREILCTFARNISERKKNEQDMLRNIEELERFSNMAVGREKQMIKLKEEINALLEEQGKARRYTIVH